MPAAGNAVACNQMILIKLPIIMKAVAETDWLCFADQSLSLATTRLRNCVTIIIGVGPFGVRVAAQTVPVPALLALLRGG